MKNFLQRMSAPQIIALGFALTILLGSGLLMLPCCVRDGVTLHYIDALYTSTSAVCVTGLIAVDSADTFTGIGQALLAVLIQIGGLGVTTVGAGVILAAGKKMDLKSRNVIREAVNMNSGKGIVVLLRHIFFATLLFEFLGAALCFPVFLQDYPAGKAIGISVFHSIAAFNNSGFDILGGMRNLAPYAENVPLNLLTCLLIFLGGIGFLVIREVWVKKFRWKSLSMHTRVVLTMSALLIAAGTVLLKWTEPISWLSALFHSVSARTAGFSTVSLGTFSSAGRLVMIVLMFIGASPGSTGGGIKTSTVFALFQGIKSAATNKEEKAFRYAVPRDAFRKAAVILVLALSVVLAGTFALLLLEPSVPFSDALFEITSAFGTVGLSTGITPGLGIGAKLLSVLIMYIGRLGPLTVASMWYFSRGERVRFAEGNLVIG